METISGQKDWLKPEAKQLMRQFQANGDITSRNQLVEMHYGLIRGVVRKFFASRGELSEDLVQEGVFGLIYAIKKYDPKRAKFTTWANDCIRSKIMHYLRDKAWPIDAPAHLKEDLKPLGDTEEKLAQRLMRLPRAWEVAEEIGWPEERVIETYKVKNTAQLTSLDQPIAPNNRDMDSSLTLEDILGDDKRPLDIEMWLDLEVVFNQLSPPQKAVLSGRILGGMTKNEVANHLNISAKKIPRLQHQVVEILKDYFQNTEGYAEYEIDSRPRAPEGPIALTDHQSQILYILWCRIDQSPRVNLSQIARERQRHFSLIQEATQVLVNRGSLKRLDRGCFGKGCPIFMVKPSQPGQLEIARGVWIERGQPYHLGQLAKLCPPELLSAPLVRLGGQELLVAIGAWCQLQDRLTDILDWRKLNVFCGFTSSPFMVALVKKDLLRRTGRNQYRIGQSKFIFSPRGPKVKILPGEMKIEKGQEYDLTALTKGVIEDMQRTQQALTNQENEPPISIGARQLGVTLAMYRIQQSWPANKTFRADYDFVSEFSHCKREDTRCIVFRLCQKGVLRREGRMKFQISQTLVSLTLQESDIITLAPEITVSKGEKLDLSELTKRLAGYPTLSKDIAFIGLKPEKTARPKTSEDKHRNIDTGQISRREVSLESVIADCEGLVQKANRQEQNTKQLINDLEIKKLEIAQQLDQAKTQYDQGLERKRKLGAALIELHAAAEG